MGTNGAIGLALPARRVDDRFVTALVHALVEPILDAGSSLVTPVVDDAAAEERLYRHWAETGGVDGVVLIDARTGDPRIPLLRSLSFPLAAVVDAEPEPDLPAVLVDVDSSVTVLRDFLDSRLARPVVHVTGPDGVARSITPPQPADGYRAVHARTESEAVAAAEVATDQGPVTLLFDSDAWAVDALRAVQARGLRVPQDVAIVSTTNSALCQSSTPSITALDRRGEVIGALLGRRVLAAVAGEGPTCERAPEPFVAIGETA